MTYSVVYGKQARRDLGALQPRRAATVMDRVDRVAADPYARDPNVKKLAGREGYRLRVGDWRVLYELDDTARMLRVVAVRPRGSAYR